jgi:sugar/nucleoside kinase (ribokinase family)
VLDGAEIADGTGAGDAFAARLLLDRRPPLEAAADPRSSMGLS